MPPSSSLADRDRLVLAGHSGGATILPLALAEEVNLQFHPVRCFAGYSLRYMRCAGPILRCELQRHFDMHRRAGARGALEGEAATQHRYPLVHRQ